MKRGSRELNISRMDPLDVPDYHFERPNDLLHVIAHMSHIQIPGLSDFKLDQLRANADSLVVNLHYSFPFLRGEGDYLFETRTFGMTVVKAKGRFFITAKNVQATGRVQLDRDAKGVYSCSSVEIKSKEDDVEINMIDLADDSLLRNFLDPRQVYEDYKPRITFKISDAFKKMLNYTLQEYEAPK